MKEELCYCCLMLLFTCKCSSGIIFRDNNNNFIIRIKYKLDSLPCKIAGKLVVAGQDKYTNNIY